MIRKFLLIFLSFCAASMTAQDMRTVFISMPDSIVPLLTKVNKEDCVDFLDSKMKAEVKNRFGNTTELKELSDNYLFMQTTAGSSLEMKLLPLNDSVSVVCMIRTVCASACDSEIRFYAADWSEELQADGFLQKPDVGMFFLPGEMENEEYASIRKKADMDLMKASLSKEDDSLTFIYTTPDYLNKEDKEKLLPYLRKEAIVLRWSDGRFVR